MALRVAACPRCKAALVFGERACRSCNQTFQYGANPPAVPTFAQIIEALQAAGMPLPPGATPTPPTRAENPNPFDMGIDSGRFAKVAEVPGDEVPGLIDSTLFAAFTPDHVDVAQVSGLDTGRFAEVGAVQPAFTPGLEVAPKDTIGEVFTQPVSGLFHSDIFRTSADVDTMPVDGFDPSPSTTRPPKPTPVAKPGDPAQSVNAKAKAKEAKRIADLGVILCRCGERHRLPRCPACGNSHPDY